MSLSRRNLLKLIASGVIGHTLDLDRLLWVPSQKTIFVPTQAQIDLLWDKNRRYLYGIPYHQFDASTGEWLGFQRELRPTDKTRKISD